MERIAYAEQFRKAVQYFATTLPEEKALVVSSIFDEWAVNVKYVTCDRVAYGVNAVGDPQLYQVLQDHTSAAQWNHRRRRSRCSLPKLLLYPAAGQR